MTGCIKHLSGNNKSTGEAKQRMVYKINRESCVSIFFSLKHERRIKFLKLLYWNEIRSFQKVYELEFCLSVKEGMFSLRKLENVCYSIQNMGIKTLFIPCLSTTICYLPPKPSYTYNYKTIDQFICVHRM